jgi:UDP-GlcNAc:undecaprenyl-phosphate GlcNAc-1-phosphate transferase
VVLPITFRIIGAGVLALIFSTLLTYGIRVFLTRRNLVKTSSEDRWHKVPVPVFGGIAMYLAFTVTALLFAEWGRPLYVLLGLGTLMFITGLVDDIRRISPPTKLIAQIAIATLVVVAGYWMSFPLYNAVNMAIALFLIVALTNAFNLLDNMDGLSAGVALTVVGIRALFFLSDGDLQGLIIAVALMGAIAGFLIHNRHPAKIFMGDCGSLFLGFSISTFFIISSSVRQSALSQNLMWVLLLSIPLIDTFFVSITRKISGRKISQGGKDHLSHRLVKAGLSEPAAVALLCVLAAAIGLTVFYLHVTGRYAVTLFIAMGVSLFAVLLGRYLAKPVDGLGAAPGENTMMLVKYFHSFKYKRFFLQIVIDIFCIVAAYYMAYLLRFGHIFGSMQMHYMVFSGFVLAPSVLLFLGIMGVYRGTWRYINITDVVNIYAGIILGTILTISFLSFAFRFTSFSRGVIVINALLLMILLPATRASYKFFDDLIFRLRDPRTKKRVLIYGAGCSGEMLLRFLRDSSGKSEEFSVVGFIDDSPGTRLNSIMGVRILGTADDLPSILDKTEVDEILISTSLIPDEKIRRVAELCAAKKNIRLFRKEIVFAKKEIPLS